MSRLNTPTTIDAAPTATHTSLKAVEKQGDQLLATIGTDYSDLTKTRLVDQVVVNHGTRPLDELYFDLKPLASNEGALEYMDLIVGKPQNVVSNPEGRFQLFRIGDAVSARNTHAEALPARAHALHQLCRLRLGGAQHAVELVQQRLQVARQYAAFVQPAHELVHGQQRVDLLRIEPEPGQLVLRPEARLGEHVAAGAGAADGDFGFVDKLLRR